MMPIYLPRHVSTLLLAGWLNSGVSQAAPETEPGSPDTAPVAHLCERIAAKLGSVQLGDCIGRDLYDSGGRTVEGSPILEKEYPPTGDRRPRARILLLGGIHGDELSSVSIMFRWMKILDKHHSGLFHWRVIPLLNPDGLLRKKAHRMNANGVDLNRNFPSPDWKPAALDYWVKRTYKNPRRYPGTDALSEPESQWFAREIEQFRPDAIVTVHAPHGIVDFDGPPEGPPKLGELSLNLLGTYPGSLGNFAGVQRRIPVITIELQYAGIMPSHRETKRIWTDLIRWLIDNIPKETPPLFAGLAEEIESLTEPVEPTETSQPTEQAKETAQATEPKEKPEVPALQVSDEAQTILPVSEATDEKEQSTRLAKGRAEPDWDASAEDTTSEEQGQETATP